MRKFNRRQLLKKGLSVAGTAITPRWLIAGKSAAVNYKLDAQKGQGYFLGAPYPQTSIWCYNQLLPGPEIRARQGQRLRIEVNNHLTQIQPFTVMEFVYP